MCLRPKDDAWLGEVTQIRMMSQIGVVRVIERISQIISTMVDRVRFRVRFRVLISLLSLIRGPK